MNEHPDNEGIAEPSLDDLLTRAALPRVVAIGETGLDRYWDFTSFDVQQDFVRSIKGFEAAHLTRPGYATARAPSFSTLH